MARRSASGSPVQIGSGLVGTLYVLDEPSIGLHQRDNRRLIDTLTRLRDLGNTVIVVEHDEETIRESDWIVDIGPGAGEHGGEVVYSRPGPGIIEGQGVGHRAVPVREEVDPGARTAAARRASRSSRSTGAREHNLQNIDVDIPLGNFVAVTGVSGSGKSTLVRDILLPVLMQRIYKSKMPAGKHKRIDGIEFLDKVIDMDQSPIGRTPRSNPATYTGVFDNIRKLFASTNEAKVRGYHAGPLLVQRQGRALRGVLGRRHDQDRDALPARRVRAVRGVQGRPLQPRHARHRVQGQEHRRGARHAGRRGGRLLRQPAAASPATCRRSMDVGLGYVRLGQSAPTLSGGEAQRVKLATELAKRSTGHTIYLLDEPTTGSPLRRRARLLTVLQRLVDQGNTVLVIEHSLDVIKTADWMIDLGPDGGSGGGTIVAEGPPEAHRHRSKPATPAASSATCSSP